MKIISNDLYCVLEVWEDPGDYPNAIAAGPLPSYGYCEYGGEFIFESENDEDFKELENVEDWVGDWIDNECNIGRYCRARYKCSVEGNRCVVTIVDAEYEAPEPDYPDREDY
jgi:hypothetical protein